MDPRFLDGMILIKRYRVAITSDSSEKDWDLFFITPQGVVCFDLFLNVMILGDKKRVVYQEKYDFFMGIFLKERLNLYLG